MVTLPLLTPLPARYIVLLPGNSNAFNLSVTERNGTKLTRITYIGFQEVEGQYVLIGPQNVLV